MMHSCFISIMVLSISASAWLWVDIARKLLEKD